MDFEVDFAKLGIRWNLGKPFGGALKHLWGVAERGVRVCLGPLGAISGLTHEAMF